MTWREDSRSVSANVDNDVIGPELINVRGSSRRSCLLRRKYNETNTMHTAATDNTTARTTATVADAELSLETDSALFFGLIIKYLYFINELDEVQIYLYKFIFEQRIIFQHHSR